MDKKTDPLDALLDQWSSTPTPPPHMKAEVWRRIALVEAEAEAPSLWERLESVFRRPSFAFTFVTACMLAGLFVAEMRVTQVHAKRSAQFASTYLQLIDPALTTIQLAGADSTGASAQKGVQP